MSDEFDYYCEAKAGDLAITPEAEKAGLLTYVDGEVHATVAGLFAIVGQMANDPAADTDGRFRKVIDRVFSAARAAGLERIIEQEIRRSFMRGINPGDGSKKGLALAAQCRLVADIAGGEQIAKLLDVRNCG